MKRLFQVNSPGGKPVKFGQEGILFYGDKQAAKTARDALNATHTGGGAYTVSPGPDHKGHLPKRTRGHRRANRTHNYRGN